MSEQSHRTRGLLLLAVAALPLAIWLLWPADAPPPAPTAPPPATELPHPKRTTSPIAPADPPAAPPRKAKPFTPEGPEQEALAAVAEATGDGVVRCELPADAPDDLVPPFHRFSRQGRTLIGLVADPAGLGIVYPAPPPSALLHDDVDAWTAAVEAAQRPTALLHWGDAWPGEEGWCTAEPPDSITLSGRVVPAEGADDPPVVVNGCGSGSSPINDDLTFSKEVDRGPPCMLEVDNSGMGHGLMVDRSADVTDLVLHQTDLSGSDAMADRMEVLRAELDELDAMADPLDAALLADDLSDEAMAVIEGWRDAARADAEQKREHFDHAAEFFRKAADE